MRIIIGLFALAILATLLSALVPLFRRVEPKKMVRILTVRVLLSIGLFLFLLIAYAISKHDPSSAVFYTQ